MKETIKSDSPEYKKAKEIYERFKHLSIHSITCIDIILESPRLIRSEQKFWNNVKEILKTF